MHWNSALTRLTPVSRNLDNPDTFSPPEVSALTRYICTYILSISLIDNETSFVSNLTVWIAFSSSFWCRLPPRCIGVLVTSSFHWLREVCVCNVCVLVLSLTLELASRIISFLAVHIVGVLSTRVVYSIDRYLACLAVLIVGEVLLSRVYSVDGYLACLSVLIVWVLLTRVYSIHKYLACLAVLIRGVLLCGVYYII